MRVEFRLKDTFPEDKFLSIELSHRGFVVTFDEEKLYGGMFLQRFSAMAISYPVIYTEASESQVVFLLRPIHSIDPEYQAIDRALRKRIEIQKVRNFFSKLGKLVE